MSLNESFSLWGCCSAGPDALDWSQQYYGTKLVWLVTTSGCQGEEEGIWGLALHCILMDMEWLIGSGFYGCQDSLILGWLESSNRGEGLTFVVGWNWIHKCVMWEVRSENLTCRLLLYWVVEGVKNEHLPFQLHWQLGEREQPTTR
jgi:hypothetical protein